MIIVFSILTILTLISFFIIYKLWAKIYNLNNELTKLVSFNDTKFLNYDSKIKVLTQDAKENLKELYEAVQKLNSDEKHSNEDINTISKRITNLKKDVYKEIEKIKNDLSSKS